MQNEERRREAESTRWVAGPSGELGTADIDCRANPFFKCLLRARQQKLVRQPREAPGRSKQSPRRMLFPAALLISVPGFSHAIDHRLSALSYARPTSPLLTSIRPQVVFAGPLRKFR